MSTATFVLLCLQSALLSFNVTATAALIPSVAAEFSIAPFMAAAIVWVYMLAYGSASLIYGPLARIFQMRRIQLVCFALFCLANLCAGWAGRIDVLLWARLCMGVFGASIIPLALIIIGTHAEEGRRGRLVGSFFSVTFVASLLGVYVSGFLYWRLIYFIPALLGSLVWLCMVRYLPALQYTSGGPKSNYTAALRNRRVVILFGYILCVSFLYHGVQQWLSVYYARQMHFGQYAISSLLTLSSLSGIFGEAFGGWSSDRWGRRRTINIGLLCMTVSVFLLLGRFHPAVYAVIMVIWGLGWTLNHAGLSTLLTDLPREFLNEAASLNSGVRFLAGGGGAAIGTLLMAQSFNKGFLALGIGFVAMFLLSNTLVLGLERGR